VTVKTGDSHHLLERDVPHRVSIGGKQPSMHRPGSRTREVRGITTPRASRSTSTPRQADLQRPGARRRTARNVVRPGVKASSGVLSPNGPKAAPATFTFSFPKAGHVPLLLHAPSGDEGDRHRHVGAAPPKSPAQVTAQRVQEDRRGLGQGEAGGRSCEAPAKTVYMGVGDMATILGYFPSTLRVPVATTVNFVNKSPKEPHSATFGPKKWIQQFSQKTDLFPMGPGKPNQAAR
jgi:plastocyanin